MCRSLRLGSLVALGLILVAELSVNGCVGDRSGSDASRILAATPTEPSAAADSALVSPTAPSAPASSPTPTLKASVRFDFDTVRITAEAEMSDDHWGAYPVWSPDGSKIAFTKLPEWSRKGGGFDWFPWHDLWIADGDGSNPRLLMPNGMAPTFSPDGEWLYYSASEPQETYESERLGGTFTQTATYRIRPDGTGNTLLYRDSPNRGVAVAPCALPDERLAVLTGQRSILFLEAYSRRILGNLPDVSGAWRYWCSPDGGHIVYQLGERLWIGPIDGSSRRLLSNVSGEEPQPVSWSADGQYMVYTTRYALWVAGRDGSNAKQIADINSFPGPKAEDYRQASILLPFLSPDGGLAFVSYLSGLKDASVSTYVVEIKSGRVRLFAEDRWLVGLSPDGATGVLMYGRQTPDKRWQRPLVIVTMAP